MTQGINKQNVIAVIADIVPTCDSIITPPPGRGSWGVYSEQDLIRLNSSEFNHFAVTDHKKATLNLPQHASHFAFTAETKENSSTWDKLLLLMKLFLSRIPLVIHIVRKPSGK